MKTLICCRTMDEVNAALAERWCQEQGLEFQLTNPRDPLFPADADGLFIDLDHLWLSPQERTDLLDSLAMRLLPYPVAVSCYDLGFGTTEVTESQGVLVSRRMDEELIQKLAAVIEQARSHVAA